MEKINVTFKTLDKETIESIEMEDLPSIGETLNIDYGDKNCELFTVKFIVRNNEDTDVSVYGNIIKLEK